MASTYPIQLSLIDKAGLLLKLIHSETHITNRQKFQKDRTFKQ
jgi:hypothetical protein